VAPTHHHLALVFSLSILHHGGAEPLTSSQNLATSYHLRPIPLTHYRPTSYLVPASFPARPAPLSYRNWPNFGPTKLHPKSRCVSPTYRCLPFSSPTPRASSPEQCSCTSTCSVLLGCATTPRPLWSAASAVGPTGPQALPRQRDGDL
jgi:hypothetical protein